MCLAFDSLYQEVASTDKNMIKVAFNPQSLGDLVVLPADERRAVFEGLLESRKAMGWDEVWTKPHKKRFALDHDHVVVGWLLGANKLLIAYVGRDADLDFEELYSQYATLSQQDYANIVTCEIDVESGDAWRITARFEIIVANLSCYPVFTTNYDAYLRNLADAGLPQIRRRARPTELRSGSANQDAMKRSVVATLLRKLFRRPLQERELAVDMHSPSGLIVEAKAISMEVPRVREDAAYFFSRRTNLRLPKFPPGTPPAPAFPLR